MLDLLSTFTNTDGSAFPNTLAVNSSGGAATDGTEFIAAMVNDQMWGWLQALLSYVDLTPNGITESPSNSQVLTALRSFEIPGKIVPVFWNDDPATLGIRAILLTGQGILRANYSELDDLVYVGDSANPTAASFYHADDAAGVTRNTAGVYLILPDARGQFIRGLDLAGSIDPDGAGRELGDIQLDAMQQITGTAEYTSNNGLVDASAVLTGAFSADATANGNRPVGSATTGYDLAFDSADSPDARTDIETRGTNICANLMITY